MTRKEMNKERLALANGFIAALKEDTGLLDAFIRTSIRMHKAVDKLAKAEKTNDELQQKLRETNEQKLGENVTPEAVKEWLSQKTDQLQEELDEAEQSFEREALGGDRSLQRAMDYEDRISCNEKGETTMTITITIIILLLLLLFLLLAITVATTAAATITVTNIL